MKEYVAQLYLLTGNQCYPMVKGDKDRNLISILGTLESSYTLVRVCSGYTFDGCVVTSVLLLFHFIAMESTPPFYGASHSTNLYHE